MTGYIDHSKSTIQAQKSILPGAPWLVAHKSMLSANKPYKLTLNGKDYVIWQNGRGEVFALDNICPHMQAPLSDGWICAEQNAIACPFHGLKFDRRGQLSKAKSSATLVQPIELTIKEDIIWTYGNLKPHLPVPDLITRLTRGYQFLGVAGEKSINAPFLNCLKINYDFNHAIATHREPFKFDAIEIKNYRENGYHTELDQVIIRSENTWQELIINPALLTVSKELHNHFEYAFPSITSVSSQTFLGELLQFFVLYPETETVTKTFILVYLKPKNKFTQILSFLVASSFLKSFDLVIEQDSSMVESLYPHQKPKIRLPREEVMFYAEQLYNQWNKESSKMNS